MLYVMKDGIEVEWEWDVRLRSYVTRFSDEVSYMIRYIEEPWDELTPELQEFYMDDARFRLGKRCPL
jgi:hypothetical protein